MILNIELYSTTTSEVPGPFSARGEETRGRRRTELKANGRIVYVWAAIDVDTRELLAMEATWPKSSLHAILFYQ
jgi:transposase-like protein